MNMLLPFHDSYQITLPFGATSPPYTALAPHQGTDYGCPSGTPLLAVCDSTVSYINVNDPRMGNAVEIDVGNGYFVRYMHLSEIQVIKEQILTMGQQIGLSGATGSVMGAHLHIEIYKKKNGQPYYYEDITKYFNEGEVMNRQDVTDTYQVVVGRDPVESEYSWVGQPNIVLVNALRGDANQQRATAQDTINKQAQKIKELEAGQSGEYVEYIAPKMFVKKG